MCCTMGVLLIHQLRWSPFPAGEGISKRAIIAIKKPGDILLKRGISPGWLYVGLLACPITTAVGARQIFCRCGSIGKIGSGNCIGRAFPPACLLKGDRGQRAATKERTISNTCHTFGNGDRGQRAAINERHTPNACYATRNRDRGQRGASLERIFPNACHAIGNRDRGQRAAIGERRITDACQLTIGNNVDSFNS